MKYGRADFYRYINAYNNVLNAIKYLDQEEYKMTRRLLNSAANSLEELKPKQ